MEKSRLKGRLYFYPRPPRGGRPAQPCSNGWGELISIHALREEGDSYSLESSVCSQAFLSTPSARRATAPDAHEQFRPSISIPALRLEGDGSSSHRPCGCRYFYPRPPRGGRPIYDRLRRDSFTISIHALREEGDYSPCVNFFSLANFYPRPPRGGRHLPPFHLCAAHIISIHALREEGDVQNSRWKTPHCLFLSTPSARRATAKTEKNISAFVSL